jgi:hypothetical protein
MKTEFADVNRNTQDRARRSSSDAVDAGRPDHRDYSRKRVPGFGRQNPAVIKQRFKADPSTSRPISSARGRRCAPRKGAQAVDTPDVRGTIEKGGR